MNWPLVSRKDFDDVVLQLSAARELLGEQRERLTSERHTAIAYERGLREIAERRLSKCEADLLEATAKLTELTTALTKKPEDTLVRLAASRSGSDPLLRRQLLTYVAAERGKGVDPETIADRLTNWTDPEDEE